MKREELVKRGYKDRFKRNSAQNRERMSNFEPINPCLKQTFSFLNLF